MPEATPPADLIRRKVDESEVYLGILALRYGHVDPGTGLSMTELEYRQALARGKPMHMFVIDDKGNLAYEGAIDDNDSSKPEDALTAKNYVAAALDATLAGSPVETTSTKPYGCGVKY